jgi:acetyl esterase/lipase
MAGKEDDRVKVEAGVVFGRGGGRELRCDIYRPPEPLVDRKSVLLVHGGGWARGDRGQLRGYGIQLGRLGYTCVSTEYRLSGESKWPAPLHDVKACLRFMRRESRGLGIDPNKIAVSGNSAGGHLALMVGATAGAAEFEGKGGSAGAGSHVSACIAFYAPTALVGSERGAGSIPALFETGVSEDVVRAASPLTYASQPDFPPTLFLHGNRDELVPERASTDMYRALRQAGVRAELHVFSEAPHAFDTGRALGRLSVQLIHAFLERHV